MAIVYLLQNQDKHFLDRSGEWVTSENNQSLYRTTHKDEAINQKVEFSVKNPHLRIAVTEACLNEKGKLLLAGDETLATLPETEIEADTGSIIASTESVLDAFDREFIATEDELSQVAHDTEPTTH